MRDAGAWLASRNPAPPEDLGTRLGRVDGQGDSMVALLTAAGRVRLDEARARPGRVRESAFRLLEADALLTYASEAALESDDPSTALSSILGAIGR